MMSQFDLDIAVSASTKDIHPPTAGSVRCHLLKAKEVLYEVYFQKGPEVWRAIHLPKVKRNKSKMKYSV